jgi:hypothetical protein
VASAKSRSWSVATPHGILAHGSGLQMFAGKIARLPWSKLTIGQSRHVDFHWTLNAIWDILFVGNKATAWLLVLLK